MSNNFSFLKKVNAGLYKIITDAERLYQDEYFEQCITQTRRFGEQVCKNILEQNNIQTGSFDEMITTLKNQSNGNIQEKEFIDDLYFLKKNGNESVHSGTVKKDAITALECLKRSFEIAINYSVYNQGASSNILKLNYDIELLITGKKSKLSLKEKYEKAKTEQIKSEKTNSKKSLNNNITYNSPKITKINIPLFWKITFILFIISILLIIFLVSAILIKN